MTGTQVATIENVVTECLPRFQAVSNSNGQLVKWQQESQFVLQALQKNDALQKCYIPSIENAIINIAACGLTLNPADGYAYLVPEYNKALRQNECMLRISFKGLIKAATDSGCIKYVKAEVVKANDKFKYNGPTTAPTHEMDPFSDRGHAIGVYCIAKTSDGDILADVMSWPEVMKIKSSAKTQMVWDKWPEEMAKKAIIKRSSKQWPKSKESSSLHETISAINATEGSDPSAIENGYTDNQKQAFDDYVAEESGLGLYLFRMYVGDDIYTSLYNTGEKGQKIKLKTKCTELEKIGVATLSAIKEAIEKDDETGLLENIEGENKATISLVKAAVDNTDTFNRIIKELN